MPTNTTLRDVGDLAEGLRLSFASLPHGLRGMSLPELALLAFSPIWYPVLAVIALALGTTVLIKMGRARYAWVTLLPLAWLLAVTMTAGWMKVFSPEPRLGFLSTAASYERQIAAGGTVAQIADWRQQAFNNHVDAVVTGVFLVLVALVVLASMRGWVELLAGRRQPMLHEEPYVPLKPANAPLP